MAKTDNHNPRAKLLLRQHFLEKYHGDGGATVLDCCQGGALMWSTLRNTHAIKSYWGVDVKPKKGRLKIDSVRVLQQGVSQNVIDIDTYGSPWKHWFAILPNITHPVTVFLTIGRVILAAGGRSLSGIEKDLMHLPPSTPPGFGPKLGDMAIDYALAKGADYATLTEAVESVSIGNARYIGVRLEPKNDGQQVATAGRPHTSVEKELKHV